MLPIIIHELRKEGYSNIWYTFVSLRKTEKELLNFGKIVVIIFSNIISFFFYFYKMIKKGKKKELDGTIKFIREGSEVGNLE